MSLGREPHTAAVCLQHRPVGVLQAGARQGLHLRQRDDAVRARGPAEHDARQHHVPPERVGVVRLVRLQRHVHQLESVLYEVPARRAQPVSRRHLVRQHRTSVGSDFSGESAPRLGRFQRGRFHRSAFRRVFSPQGKFFRKHPVNCEFGIILQAFLNFAICMAYTAWPHFQIFMFFVLPFLQ